MTPEPTITTETLYETLDQLHRLAQEFQVMTTMAFENPAEQSQSSDSLRQAADTLAIYMEKLHGLLGKADTQALSLWQKRQSALTSLALLIPETKGLNAVLEHITALATKLLPCKPGACILRWSGEDETFSLLAHSLPEEMSRRILAQANIPESASRWIAEHQTSLILPDVSAHPLGKREFIPVLEGGAILGLPLVAKGQSLGILYGVYDTNRNFAARDIEFMSALADHASQAITYVSVLSRLQLGLQTAGSLFTLSSSVLALADSPKLLQTIADSVAATLSASTVTMVMMDLSARLIKEVVASGPKATTVGTYDFSTYWQGLSGWVIREGELALSSGLQPDSRESPEAQAIREQEGLGPMMVAPLIYGDDVFGTISVAREKNASPFREEDLILLNALAQQAATALANAEKMQTNQRLESLDELTGINNRRAFLRLARHEFSRSERTGKPLSAIIFDLDFFKKINESYGHNVGDQVLQEVAKRCLECIRTADIVGRYGGEEFIIVLPETDLQVAQIIAERMRLSIGMNKINTSMGPLSTQITLGVSTKQENTTSLLELLTLAENALATGKAMGRNCVMLA